MIDLLEGVLSEFSERQNLATSAQLRSGWFGYHHQLFNTGVTHSKLDRARYTARRRAAGKCLRCANPSTSARCAMCNQLRREKRRAAKALKK